ncbi:MAG: hypothetical protein ACTTH7_04095 [Treponema sp.]
MVKKILKLSFFVTLLYEILTLSSCKPVIGTPFYPRAAETVEAILFSIKITVAGKETTAKLTSAPKDDLNALELYAAAKEYMVTVPYSCEELSAADIAVEAVSSLTAGDKVPVEITINGETVPLTAGKTFPITIKIQDTGGLFGVIEKVIKVTRQEQSAMQQDLTLKSIEVHGVSVDISSGAVAVPYAHSAVAPSDIKATFILNNEDTIIPVEMDNAPIKLQENTTTEVLIRVKEKAGQYNAFEKKLAILREQKKDDEDTALQLEHLSVLGYDALSGSVVIPDMGRPLTPNDVVASFKDFGVLDVEFKGGNITVSDTALLMLSIPAKKGSYLAWETSIRLIKDPSLVINPEDKNGNKKYSMSVKTVETETDPFQYYGKDYGFPASKFDEWIVYISGFNTSTNVPSYQFKSGTWTGTPEVYAGPDFGSGVKKMGNVKFYRYTSRKDRWNGTAPLLFDAEKEKRFYFYRFTASGGVDLDNSLFCVDTYSKFIFFYSEPDSISNLGVPSGWTDYAAPSSGKHRQFGEPFYLSDPVGFVKEDGQVVLYSWIKDNISANNYAAQKNPLFEKPAEQKAGKEGYSPYRNPIKRKYQEPIKKENPAYTVSLPVITRQPAAIRINPDAAGSHTFSVRVAQPPEGEVLSYQWYENTIQSDQGGVPIQGAVQDSYAPDKTQQKDCYVYCAITNTNPLNGAAETIRSYAVKLLIKSGPLSVDAEPPEITKQPENSVIPINTEKKVTLTVKALSMDKGELSFQWYKTADKNAENGEKIPDAEKETYEFTPDSSAVSTMYYYCAVTNTNNAVDGKKIAVKKTAYAAVVIEASYQVDFYVHDSGGGKITAICDGKQIKSGAYVKKGLKVTFFAQADKNYEVLEWSNVSAGTILGNNMVAHITVGSGKPSPVVVTFRKIPDTRRLTITAKELKNVDLYCKYDKWNNYNEDHAYFVYNFKFQISAAGKPDPNNYQSLWSINNGEDATNGFTQVSKIKKLMKGEAATTSNATMKEFSQKPDTQFFWLNTKLVKYDCSATSATVDKQVLSNYDQSVVEFFYDKTADVWKCRKAAIAGNFTILNVEASFNEQFVLERGKEQDFTITYYVDNAANYAVGRARVTYTLKWE